MKFAVNSLLFSGTMTEDDLPLVDKVAAWASTPSR